MSEPPIEIVARPTLGRVHRGTRRVRLGDVDLDGVLRLDAVARYLQDAGNDDTDDAGLGNGGAWVTRRVVAEFEGAMPRYLDDVETFTFCGGYSKLVVERRTDIAHPRGAIRTATVWAYLDPSTMRPTAVPDWFHEIYAATAAGRTVRGKLTLPPPAPDASARSLELRMTDFDVLGHVNNAIAWGVLQEECLRHFGRSDIRRTVLEYSSAIEAGTAAIDVRSDGRDSSLSMWMMTGDEVCVAAWAAFA